MYDRDFDRTFDSTSEAEIRKWVKQGCSPFEDGDGPTVAANLPQCVIKLLCIIDDLRKDQK